MKSPSISAWQREPIVQKLPLLFLAAASTSVFVRSAHGFVRLLRVWQERLRYWPPLASIDPQVFSEDP